VVKNIPNAIKITAKNQSLRINPKLNFVSKIRRTTANTKAIIIEGKKEV
jgi:hypothetical protein